MSNAKVLSTKFIGFVSNASRTVQVGYVDKTDIWTRSFLDTDIQKKFEQAAQDNIDTLRADTAMIALQETPHASQSDSRTHWTAVEINSSNKVIAKRHFANFG